MLISMVGPLDPCWPEGPLAPEDVGGLAGVVIDGTIRDREALAARGFPVFQPGTHPPPATKEFAGELHVPRRSAA